MRVRVSMSTAGVEPMSLVDVGKTEPPTGATPCRVSQERDRRGTSICHTWRGGCDAGGHHPGSSVIGRHATHLRPRALLTSLVRGQFGKGRNKITGVERLQANTKEGAAYTA